MIEDRATYCFAAMDEQRREQAMTRFAVLRPHLESSVPLARSAGEAGIPTRTAERWLTRYRQGGLAGLARPTRRDAGTHRVSADLVTLIEGMALKRPRSSAAAIHRRVGAVAKTEGWQVHSYSTVHAIITALDPGMMTLAQEGPAAFRDRFELVHRHRAEAPNAIWQADHTLLDLLIRDEGGKPARPWLTTVVDDHSRVIAGYMVFLGAPCVLNTCLALRQPSGARPMRPGPSAASRTCFMSTTAATSPATTSIRWRPACASASSTPPSGDRRAAARSSAYSERSTRSCCPNCLGTSSAESRRPRRACLWRSWTGPSRPSWPASITSAPTARSAWRRSTLGGIAPSCLVCPRAWRTSTCCW